RSGKVFFRFLISSKCSLMMLSPPSLLLRLHTSSILPYVPEKSPRAGAGSSCRYRQPDGISYRNGILPVCWKGTAQIPESLEALCRVPLSGAEYMQEVPVCTDGMDSQ